MVFPTNKRIVLILVMGLPGTGKSTFARALANEMGAEHLNSDQIRTAMGKRGAYTPDDKQEVYAELLRRTASFLEQGQNVIVDSTFYRESIRRPFVEAAHKYKIPLLLIEIRANEDTLKERLAKPRLDSEADFAVYRKIKAAYEPPDGLFLEFWSDRQSLEEMVQNTFLELQNKGLISIPTDMGRAGKC